MSALMVGCVSQEVARPEATTIDPQTIPTPVLRNPALIRGRQNYEVFCAHCHGLAGEGQLASTIENTLNLGMHTVPPHDASGHTWQHPDQLLLIAIRDGIENPLSHYVMAGYGDVMTDGEIMEVINYMKLFWTHDQRRYQALLTERWAEINGE